MFFGRKKKNQQRSPRNERPLDGMEPESARTPLAHEMVRDIAKQLGRRLIVLGACWGTEVHQVILDPLFTVKGYQGDPGLEAYAEFNAIQLSVTESMDDLIRACCEHKADVVVVSRMAASHELVLSDLKRFVEELNRAGGTQHKFIKIAVSPKLTHDEARALGFEAGFGAGTAPSQLISVVDR